MQPDLDPWELVSGLGEFKTEDYLNLVGFVDMVFTSSAATQGPPRIPPSQVFFFQGTGGQ